ncbi:hypothetical protein [Luteitalea sp.]|uniref:hypothetical protein n=1 Tax=Luteitalea sp. TaxID=2004800 RepID=UPI0037C9770F
MLLALYLLEAGLLLILAPWTAFWDRNYFAALAPSVASWITHPYVRGAVSGVGIVSVAGALIEIGMMLSRGAATPRA